MSNHNIDWLVEKIKATEAAMKERSLRYTETADESVMSELDVLDRMHTGLIDAHRRCLAYDKLADKLVDL